VKSQGGILVGGDFCKEIQPEPLDFLIRITLAAKGKQRFSFCLTASEIKFREAMRLPFSKGIEHWGIVRRQWGKAPFPSESAMHF